MKPNKCSVCICNCLLIPFIQLSSLVSWEGLRGLGIIPGLGCGASRSPKASISGLRVRNLNPPPGVRFWLLSEPGQNHVGLTKSPIYTGQAQRPKVSSKEPCIWERGGAGEPAPLRNWRRASPLGLTREAVLDFSSHAPTHSWWP